MIKIKVLNRKIDIKKPCKDRWSQNDLSCIDLYTLDMITLRVI